MKNGKSFCYLVSHICYQKTMLIITMLSFREKTFLYFLHVRCMYTWTTNQMYYTYPKIIYTYIYKYYVGKKIALLHSQSNLYWYINYKWWHQSSGIGVLQFPW